MKIWLDDVRLPPDDSWTWCKTAGEAMHMLRTGTVKEISFDHDLGENSLTGYDVAKYIEENYNNACLMGNHIKWYVHSANPVGRKNIEAAMTKADYLFDKFWGIR